MKEAPDETFRHRWRRPTRRSCCAEMPWVEERLSCTRGLIYNLIADGKLEVVRFGRAVRITERSVLKLVNEQLKQRA